MTFPLREVYMPIDRDLIEFIGWIVFCLFMVVFSLGLTGLLGPRGPGE